MTELLTTATVGDLMHRDPIVVHADAPLAEAARLIDHHRISGLPVAAAARLTERERVHRLVVVREDDERIPIGIMSPTDLVHAMVERPADG